MQIADEVEAFCPLFKWNNNKRRTHPILRLPCGTNSMCANGVLRCMYVCNVRTPICRCILYPHNTTTLVAFPSLSGLSPRLRISLPGVILPDKEEPAFAAYGMQFTKQSQPDDASARHKPLASISYDSGLHELREVRNYRFFKGVEAPGPLVPVCLALTTASYKWSNDLGCPITPSLPPLFARFPPCPITSAAETHQRVSRTLKNLGFQSY